LVPPLRKRGRPKNLTTSSKSSIDAAQVEIPPVIPTLEGNEQCNFGTLFTINYLPYHTSYVIILFIFFIPYSINSLFTIIPYHIRLIAIHIKIALINLRYMPGSNDDHTPNPPIQNKRQRSTTDASLKPLSSIIQKVVDHSSSSNSKSSYMFVDPPKRKHVRPNETTSTGESENQYQPFIAYRSIFVIEPFLK
jgi:hypothetical protein